MIAKTKIDLSEGGSYNGVSVILSEEHKGFSQDIEDCFDNQFTIQPVLRRYSMDNLHMQIILALTTGLLTNAIYDIVKNGIKRLFHKFPKCSVVVEDKGVKFVVRADNSVQAIVVDEMIEKFKHVKTIENLISFLQSNSETVNIDWKETTLREVIIPATERIPVSNLTVSNYISTENMEVDIGGVRDAVNLPTISNVLQFLPGDILFSNIRTYFKKLWQSDRFGGASNDVLIFRGNDMLINQSFLFYVLSQDAFFEHTVKTSKGTKMPRGDKDAILNFSFLLPPLSYQKSLVEILLSLDSKIELLREQNKTLESTGQLLFNEWFLGRDAIPKQRLGDLVVVKRGGSPRPIQDYISETGLRWLKISDASATESPFIFNIKEHIKVEGLKKTTLLKAGSLVLSNSATPGIPKILAVDSCIHDGWLHFPKSTFSNEFLYLLFQAIRPQLIQQGSGSVFTNLKTDILKDFQAPLPDDTMLSDFNSLIKPIFQKIFDNASQIQTLSLTRNTILPKLIKGEVRVN